MVSLGAHFASLQRARLGLALSAAALVVSLVCAGHAQATCGDYLQMDDDHQEMGAVDSSTGTMPSDAPCGCTGAECRRAPAAPLAPRSPARWHSPQDCSLSAHADCTLSLPSSRTHARAAERPLRGFPLLLNRPPDQRT
jgi:hypothetical protein